jgi:hypothetical protein
MKPLAKLGYLAAACALVVATFTIIGPRAVRAAVATLVQVVNTAAAPAITQDVSRLASQNVELSCNPTCSQVLASPTLGFVLGGTFTVPAGQHFVISTIQLDITGGGVTELSQQIGSITSTGRTTLLTTAAGTYQYQYPSGIVIEAGNSLSFGSGVLNIAYIYGYLTSN